MKCHRSKLREAVKMCVSDVGADGRERGCQNKAGQKKGCTVDFGSNDGFACA
jgi:hypothetical protein